MYSPCCLDKLAEAVKQEILRERKTLEKACHIAVVKLYKRGLEGVPLIIYFRHPRTGWSNHVVFVLPNLIVLDVTGEQYGNIPPVYALDSIKKYYDIISYDIGFVFFYAGRPATKVEADLERLVRRIMAEMTIKPKKHGETKLEKLAKSIFDKSNLK